MYDEGVSYSIKFVPPEKVPLLRDEVSDVTRDTRKSLGKRGEDAALIFLESLGMVFIDRNIHSRSGEIDLVLADRDTLVFCEVKTRRTVRAAAAVESYTHAQTSRLGKQIQIYLMRNPWDGPLRVDLVALQKVEGKDAYRIEHLTDAVQFDEMW